MRRAPRPARCGRCSRRSPCPAGRRPWAPSRRWASTPNPSWPNSYLRGHHHDHGRAQHNLPRYQHVIDGRRVEAASGQRYDSVDPYLGAPWASAADGDAADVDPRRGGGPARAGRAVGPAHRVRPGRADAPARRPDRAGRGPAGRDRDPRYGQAAARDARAAGHDPAVVLLLLRAGGQARGHHDPGRQAELPRLHPARAGRRGRGDRAVELPAAAAVLEAGPGAGRGLHDGGQAVATTPPPRRSSWPR